MAFWLILLSIDAACGGYLTYLWAHGHAALLQGLPHGTHGQGFLTYLAVVVVLTSLNVWVLCMARRPAFKVWIVILDGLAAAVYQVGLLSDLQQQFGEWAVLTALLTNFLLVFNVPFWLGGLFEGRSHAGSLEVHE